MRQILLLIGVLAVVVSSGCASSSRQVGIQLGARMDGDNMVLSWPAAADKHYTVLYNESLQSPDWRPLAGHVNLQGTGTEMRVVDQAAPHGTRFYRLYVGTYPTPAPPVAE